MNNRQNKKERMVILANNSDGLYRFRSDFIQSMNNYYDTVVSTPFDTFVPELQCICHKVIETKVDRRGINPIKDFQLINAYRRIIKNEKPGLVVTYTIKPNIYGGLISQIKNVPYVVNITGLGSVFDTKGILRELVIRLYHLALKKVKIVFFENEGDRDLFVKSVGIPLEKTHVLHGAGVNTEKFIYQQYPQNKAIHFLFVGRVMKEKGIDELLEATEKLIKEGANCFLDVVGPCEEDYSTVLSKCERQGWLKYHGFQTDVRPFIESCDCFVLPSYHEGMANTNLECAASGRPIITSNIPGCKEAVLETKSGLLCEPHNSDSLLSCMRTMINLNREDRIQMGVAGRKHMLKHFEKKVVVRETVEAIQQALL